MKTRQKCLPALGLVSLLLRTAANATERLPAEHDSFVRIRHERTAAWPHAAGENQLRNALVRGQASVLLFMAPEGIHASFQTDSDLVPQGTLTRPAFLLS